MDTHTHVAAHVVMSGDTVRVNHELMSRDRVAWLALLSDVVRYQRENPAQSDVDEAEDRGYLY